MPFTLIICIFVLFFVELKILVNYKWKVNLL